MHDNHTGSDWVFIGGIALAILCMVAFAAIALYTLATLPR
jgi:hypothetical protein